MDGNVKTGGHIMQTQQTTKKTTLKKDQHKVTRKRVNDFYKKLNLPGSISIPVGSFELFESISVTESANAGV